MVHNMFLFVRVQVNGVHWLRTMSVDVMGTAEMLIVLQGVAEELPSALKLTVVKVKGFSFWSQDRVRTV